MEKKTIIKINDIKEFVVKDINRLKLDDIRKFIIKEFNTGKDFIYLYGNNSNKPIYSLRDLLSIKEEDYEHNLCLIKIRFNTLKNNNYNNDNNYLSRTMVLNNDQIKKANYGIKKDTNNNNNIQMRDSNKMNRYKNNFTNSGKNQKYYISKNSDKFINNIKTTNNPYTMNNNGIKSIKNIYPNLINQKVNDNITGNTNIIYNNANNTSNKNINNYINKTSNQNININNNMSNASNKNVNNYINKTSNQNINNNINNSNQNINDSNKNNTIIQKESSNNITESDKNIINISNKSSKNNISNNSSNKNIDGSSKENSIKFSNKKVIKKKLNILNKPSQDSETKKNLLKEISGDINEDQKNKEELEKYKEELQKEIKNLENELSDLKKENENIIKEGDNDDDISLNEETIENLKKIIINEVNSKIEKELKSQINEGLKKMNKENIKNHEKQINDKFDEIKKEYKERVDKEVGELKTKLEEFKNKFNENKNKDIHNIDNNIEEFPQNQSRIKTNQKFKREKGPNNNNLNKFSEKNSDEMINEQLNNNRNNPNYNKFIRGNSNKNPNDIINDGQENVEDEDVNLNNSGRNIKYFNKQYVNPNYRKSDSKSSNNMEMERKKSNDYSRQIQIQNKPPIHKKKSQEINLLNLLNAIFFKNKEQTEINIQKIEQRYLDIIRDAYIKHLNDENNIVYMYVNSFIKTNILRLFKNRRYTKYELEIVKVKISLILQCIDMNKDYYSAYFYPEMEKPEKRNYYSSVEAAKRFRKEYNVGEDVIKEDRLINYLYNNNNNLPQTFGEIFGK